MLGEQGQPDELDVISALEAALAADETNVTLRCHLAQLLAAAGRHADALAHAAAVLQASPGHAVAARLAAASAAALNPPPATGAPDAVEPPSNATSPFPSTGAPGPPPGLSSPPPATRGTEASESLPEVPSSPPVAGPTDAAGSAPGVPPAMPGPAGSEAPEAFPISPDVPETADELLDRWSGSDAPREPEIGELSAPGARLSDVAGLVEVKRRLELSFLAPLRNPQVTATFGKSLRGGLLLWGPPGCGKTFIARALAGELGARFYAVGLSDVLDMWVGGSERNLRTIFDVARRNRPCVLFFDEVDAIGRKRTQLRSGGAAMRGVVNQLLAELDGASADNDGVFVLAATNHLWDVDPALLRPGRFDRTLLVLPPDAAAREAILRLHLRGKPTEGLDLRRVAQATDGLSGADLALICDHATERAMTTSLQAGAVRPISQADLSDAARQVRSSVDPWLDTARNFAVYSNESGAYDELHAYLKRRR